MNKNITNALRVDMVVDVTTTGRKTGGPRRIEIWAHCIDGRILMTGSPGTRSWYANMLADPKVTLHLKDDVKADLPATARAVTDDEERRELLTAIKSASRFDSAGRWTSRSGCAEAAWLS